MSRVTAAQAQTAKRAGLSAPTPGRYDRVRNPGSRTVRDLPVLADKYSEHGTGHFSDPRDPKPDGHETPFVAELWQYILNAELGQDPAESEWFHRPAITRRTISTPRLHHLLGNGRDSHLRPFSFCNHAILHPDERQVRGRDDSTWSLPTNANPVGGPK
jgi:hypothetical protein